MARPVVIVRRRWQDFPPPTPQPTICKIWQGAVDKDGYGQILSHSHWASESDQKQRYRVYRWVWEHAHGPIPKGMVVRHKCDNRLCYRLSHLELGTVAENNADAALRGHLGPAFAHPPSRIARLFDDWDAWEGSASSFRRANSDIPDSTIRRYISQGRSHFFPEESDGDTEHEYLDADARTGIHPIEQLAEIGSTDDRTSRNLAAWRRRNR